MLKEQRGLLSSNPGPDKHALVGDAWFQTSEAPALTCLSFFLVSPARAGIFQHFELSTLCAFSLSLNALQSLTPLLWSFHPLTSKTSPSICISFSH